MELKSFLDEFNFRRPKATYKGIDIYTSDRIPKNHLWFVNFDKDEILKRIENIKID